MRSESPPSRSQTATSPRPLYNQQTDPATSPEALTQAPDSLEGAMSAQASGEPRRTQHTVGLQPPTAVRQSAPAAAAQIPPHPARAAAGAAMTLASLDEWAAQPEQSTKEHQQRQEVVSQLTSQNQLGQRCLTQATNLDLGGYSALTHLPDGLAVGRELDLRRCTALTHPPDGLAVGRDLDLRECIALTHIPDGLAVGRDLDLSGCTALTHLPDGLVVREDLGLYGCIALTHLPDELAVGRNLHLHCCTALTHLPDKLAVGGDLNLMACTALTHLPDGLAVGRNLDLRRCIALTHLPDGLAVEGNLHLRDCTALTHLPDGLAVDGDLDLRGCIALTHLPEAVLHWGMRSNGPPHFIDITGSGIREEVVQRMRDAAGPGVQIFFGAQEQPWDTNTAFTDLASALSFWATLVPTGSRPAQPAGADPAISLHGNAAQTQALLAFLDRLRGTADHQNVNTRPMLAQRALQVIDSVTTSEALAQLCHERIDQALESCGDRVMWAMNQLEVAIKVHNARQSAEPAEALEALGRSLLRLEVVNEHAAKKVSSLRAVDPIEVYLAYETRLAEQLQLPVSAQAMLYGHLANVTDADLQDASRAAKAADADPKRVAAFLQSWDPWQQLDRRAQVAALQFEKLTPLSAKQSEPDEVCAISQQTLAEMQEEGIQVVAHAKPQGNWQIFAYKDLMKWWAEHGTDPTLQKPLMLTDLRSVVP